VLTDDQARRFCGCETCHRVGGTRWIDADDIHHDAVCRDCNGTGIDPTKRAELEELGLAPNPHAKEPTGEHCQHPGRNGKHELYVSPSGYYCRACGYREAPTDV
jgi:hypothetical protein